MPEFFYESRERSSEEIKSEGRIRRERQWGSKVERAIRLAVYLRDSQPSVFISSFLQPFTGWEVRVSPCGLNKATLVEQSGQEVGSSEASHYG